MNQQTNLTKKSNKNTQNEQLLLQQSKNSNFILFHHSLHSNSSNIHSQHIYSLFLLLFYHGEIKHCQLMIEKAEECRDLYLLHVCEEDKSAINYLKVKQARILVQALGFFMEQLKKTDKLSKNNRNNSMVFQHRPQQKIKIRRAILTIYELENGQISNDQQLSIHTLAKMAASLIRIKCTLRDFQQFSLIQFTCPLFKKNNIEVFIQINKQKQTYKYIKQSLQNVDCIQKQLKLAKLGTQFSSDSFMEMPYIKFRCLETKYDEISEDQGQGNDYSYTETCVLTSQKSKKSKISYESPHKNLQVRNNSNHIHNNNESNIDHDCNNKHVSPKQKQQNYLVPSSHFVKNQKYTSFHSNPATLPYPSPTISLSAIASSTFPQPSSPSPSPVIPKIVASSSTFINSISSSLYKININKLNSYYGSQNSGHFNCHQSSTDDCCNYRGKSEAEPKNDDDNFNVDISKQKLSWSQNYESSGLLDNNQPKKLNFINSNISPDDVDINNELENYHDFDEHVTQKILSDFDNKINDKTYINNTKQQQQQQKPIPNLFKSIFSTDFIQNQQIKSLQFNQQSHNHLNTEQQQLNNFTFENIFQKNCSHKNSIFYQCQNQSQQFQQQSNLIDGEIIFQQQQNTKNNTNLTQLQKRPTIVNSTPITNKILVEADFKSRSQQNQSNNFPEQPSNFLLKYSLNNLKHQPSKNNQQQQQQQQCSSSTSPPKKSTIKTKQTLTSSTTVDSNFHSKLALKIITSHGYEAPQYIKYQSPNRSKYSRPTIRNNNTNTNTNTNNNDDSVSSKSNANANANVGSYYKKNQNILDRYRYL